MLSELLGWVLWLLGVTLKRFDYALRWIGDKIGRPYAYPVFIFVQACTSYCLALFFAIQFEHWTSTVLGIVIAGGAIMLIFFIYLFGLGYETLRWALMICVTEYRGLFILVKSAGYIIILKLFVFLINDIERSDKVDLYVVGFFLSCQLLVTSVSKLFKSDDILGIGDNMIAMGMLIWVNYPTLKLEAFVLSAFGEKSKGIVNWLWIFFYGIDLFLVLFKLSEISLKGVNDYEILPKTKAKVRGDTPVGTQTRDIETGNSLNSPAKPSPAKKTQTTDIETGVSSAVKQSPSSANKRPRSKSKPSPSKGGRYF